MKSYKALNNSVFIDGKYSIVPLRNKDRYNIMQWRNEQIYHLRQHKPLTKEAQDAYFENVVAQLFEQSEPNQILFSFLENDVCVGYGGLVHINWIDKNAEVSFIMDTSLEKTCFSTYWSAFLKLLEKVAFDELGLHKVYVYAFDLRPHLYEVLIENNFFLDARLRNHCCFNDEYIDVVVHSKLSSL
jgi:RimJ/RimL family protein N-acetyltransferase